jgi:polar amino acid transport system substrate-binding protein
MAKKGKLWRLLGLLLAVTLVAAACGGDDDGDGDAAEEGGGGAELTELGAELPEEIQESGTITVGSDIAYPPVEFYEEGDEDTAVGIDPDLGAALGEKLGVEFEFVNGTFDGLITGLQSARYDLIMSAMSATEERAEEISFVHYFEVGTSILVAKGNPEGIESLDDLCGHTVALQRGTTQEEVVTEQAAACEEQGDTLEILPFDTDPEALLQVKNGRAVADLNDFPVAAWTAQTESGGEDFEVVGEQIDAGPYGIGIRKEDSELRDAIVAALEAVIEDGTYDEILEEWDVSQGALKTAEVTGA